MNKLKNLSLFKYTVILAAFFAFFQSLLSIYKFDNNLYNLLDLGIFKNALSQNWSNFLFSTIQGHHYYADHLSPYLILIKPIYDLIPNPLILVFLQLGFIIWGGFELVKLNNNRLNWPLDKVLVTLYFFNPWLWLISLNEFHILPLFLPFFFIIWRHFESDNFNKFVVWFLLALILREDVCLSLVFFSFFAVLYKKTTKWIIFPLISVPYFFVAQKIMGYFGAENYAFLAYYSWLGQGWGEIIKTLFTSLKPWARIISYNSLNFFVGALLPFLFLPLKKPVYLLLGLLPFLALALGPGASPLILKFHYFIPMFCGLFLSFFYSLNQLQKDKLGIITKHSSFIYLLSVIVALLLQINFGPVKYFTDFYKLSYQQKLASIQNELLNKINENSSVLSSSALLSKIKSTDVYYLKYAATGKQQFDKLPYKLPEDLRYIFIDSDELIYYSLRNDGNNYQNELTNISSILKNYKLIDKKDSYLLFEKSESSNLSEFAGSTTKVEESSVKLLSIEENFAKIRFEVSKRDIISDHVLIKVVLENNPKQIVRYLPIGFGLINIDDIKNDEAIYSIYDLLIPNKKISASWSLVEVEGNVVGNDLISAELEITKEREITKPQTFLDANEVALLDTEETL